MIGVSIRKVRNFPYADKEFFYQCPYCGKNQYYMTCPAFICEKCGKMIDTVVRLFDSESVLNRLTFHMGGVLKQFMRYYPYDENKIKIMWQEDDRNFRVP
jgi:hypothetical protein